MDQKTGRPLRNLFGFAPYFNNNKNVAESWQYDSGDSSAIGEFGFAPSFNNSSTTSMRGNSALPPNEAPFKSIAAWSGYFR
jgi:hypothetical protein